MYHSRLLPRPHLVPACRVFNTSLRHRNVPRSPYHALLKLDEGPNQFIVNLAQLKRNFIQAQRLAHPDKVVGQGAVRWTHLLCAALCLVQAMFLWTYAITSPEYYD
jgi:hypothetical protein